MAESDSARRLHTWNEAQDRLAEGESAIDRMLSDMAMAKTGWHCVRGEDGNVSAYLPSVPNYASDDPRARAAEDEWEARSIACHDQQVPVEMPTKPLERSRMRSAVAAFDVVHGDAESPERPPQRTLMVPKFHETSPASTEVQRRSIKRSN